MSLIKRSEWPVLTSPTTWLTDFFDNRFFDSDWLRNQSLPAVNVKETDTTYEVEMAAPGLEKKDFQITTDSGILTISSEKEEETEKREKNYTRKEFSYSSFTRSFTMPENVKEDDIKATYENGILKLVLTKEKGSVKVKKAIEVK